MQGTSNRIRLLLVDDLVLAREALGSFLASNPDFEVVGQCGTAFEALARLKQVTVDVVVIEHRLTHHGGLQFLAAALEDGYAGRVLVIADPSNLGGSLEVLQLGAGGVFPKDSALESLVKAIFHVAGGNTWLDPRVVRILTERVPRLDPVTFRVPLSEREQQVLRALSEGLTNRRIADRLDVSEGTVKSTLRDLFKRLNVQNRSQLLSTVLAAPDTASLETYRHSDS